MRAATTGLHHTRADKRALRVIAAIGALVALTLAAPPAGAVNQKQLREARNRYRQVQEQLNKLAEEYARQEEKLENLQIKIGATNRSIRKANSEVDSLENKVRLRIRAAYRLGGVGVFDFLLSSTSFRDFSLRAVMLERQASDDEDLILKLRRLRADLAAKERSLKGQKRSQTDLLGGLRRKAGQLDAAFGTAQALLARLEGQRRSEELARLTRRTGGGGGRAFALSRCPAAGPRAFSNDWGAPRGGGRRSHKGNDIFAPMGSSAVAVVPGVISRHSSGGNAGLGVYLWGDDGNEYFYAHMSGFAGSSGRRVGAGETVAYVGNTGNARGGAPHIHFEVHPGGGRPVNPYPSLIRVC